MKRMNFLEICTDGCRVRHREVAVSERGYLACRAQLPPIRWWVAGNDRNDRNDFEVEALGQRHDDDLARVDGNGNAVDLEHVALHGLIGVRTLRLDVTARSSAHL